ncbi:MAG: hypothetical protein ACF8NJ_00190 [Phycisphaerales bacterium JB038]
MTRDPEPAEERSESDAAPAPRRRHPLILALHLIGYALGLVLMGYCVWTAIEGDALARLGQATPLQILGLFLCSFVSVTAHGATWWLLMRPLVRLSFNRVQAINAIASLLFYAPAKLSVVARVALHRRADRLGYGRMAAWFVAGSLCMGVPFAAMILPALMVGLPVAARIGVSFAAMLAGVAAIVLVARFHLIGRLLRGSERMLIHPHIVAGAVLLRFLDLSAMTLRLRLACDVLGQPVSLSDAYALTVMPLLGGVISPIGALGAREWLTGLLGRLVDATEQETFQSAATVATAAEASVLIVLGLIGLILIRPHRRFETPNSNITE